MSSYDNHTLRLDYTLYMAEWIMIMIYGRMNNDNDPWNNNLYVALTTEEVLVNKLSAWRLKPQCTYKSMEVEYILVKKYKYIYNNSEKNAYRYRQKKFSDQMTSLHMLEATPYQVNLFSC